MVSVQLGSQSSPVHAAHRRQLANVALIGIAVLMAACGGGGNLGSGSHSVAALSRTSTSTPSSYETESDAVLQAYRASWKAFEEALSTANAYDQGLSATMVGTQLQNVRANLLGDRSAGVVGRGSVTLHPKIGSVSATTASVVDCSYSTSELIYAKSGKPVPPVTPPENDQVHATLVFAGGAWKVSLQKVTEGSCDSDS